MNLSQRISLLQIRFAFAAFHSYTTLQLPALPGLFLGRFCNEDVDYLSPSWASVDLRCRLHLIVIP